jgi:dTDP-4-dehydrorhamnose reductase
MRKKLLISGGSGRFASEIIKQNTEFEIYAPNKKDMDITSLDSLNRAIDRFSPDMFLHPAALTRPMIKHVQNPEISIRTNIIGTSNVCLTCMSKNIKLIYISTDYVYPGVSGNYKETDALLPINLYAWSKLGGECAIRLYPNSLILRTCMTERPFVHPKALIDSQKSLMYIDEAVSTCFKLKLFDKHGIINLGGPPTNPYEFIKDERPNVEKIYRKDILDVRMPEDSTMNLTKLGEILDED